MQDECAWALFFFRLSCASAVVEARGGNHGLCKAFTTPKLRNRGWVIKSQLVLCLTMLLYSLLISISRNHFGSFKNNIHPIFSFFSTKQKNKDWPIPLPCQKRNWTGSSLKQGPPHIISKPNTENHKIGIIFTSFISFHISSCIFLRTCQCTTCPSKDMVRWIVKHLYCSSGIPRAEIRSSFVAAF